MISHQAQKSTAPPALRFFPPNTLRRLGIKACLALCRHPLCCLQGLLALPWGKCLHWLVAREYALLEDKLRLAISITPRPDPAVLARLQPGAETLPSVCLGIHVTREILSKLPASMQALAQLTHQPRRLLILCSDGLTPEEIKIHCPGLPPAQIIQNSGQVLSAVVEDYLGFLQAGDVLAPEALQRMLARPAVAARKAGLIYCDDSRGAQGQEPENRYKPGWSPELLLSRNYIGEFYLLKSQLALAAGGLPRGYTSAAAYDLLLRAADRDLQAEHVPEVLHYSQQQDLPPLSFATWQRRKLPGALPAPHFPEAPLVSIIIPTALREPRLLQRCLESVMQKSRYKNIEIILVDNRPIEAPLPEPFCHWPIQQVRFPEPFNYSRMNNRAAALARGEYLLLLNDDTEVITPDWIEALLAFGQMPGVGVVGAHLLYPDGSTQHGGIVCLPDASGVRHAFRHLRRVENSYQGLLGLARNCSAVTFACALIPRRTYKQLGGLDEEMAVEYNDIDFCLRVLAAGQRIVWTPFARLYHKELVTRRRTHFVADQTRFQQRWQETLAVGDPYYNPNLSLETDFYLPLGGCRQD